MSIPEPTVLLVHGAFAESASWNAVIRPAPRAGSRRHRRRQPAAQRQPPTPATCETSSPGSRARRPRRPLLRRRRHLRGGVRPDPCVGAGVRRRLRAGHGRVGAAAVGDVPRQHAGRSARPTYPCHRRGRDSRSGRGSSPAVRADVPAPDAAQMGATQRPVTAAALAKGCRRTPGVANDALVVRVRRRDRNVPAALSVVDGRARCARRGPGSSRGPRTPSASRARRWSPRRSWRQSPPLAGRAPSSPR